MNYVFGLIFAIVLLSSAQVHRKSRWLTFQGYCYKFLPKDYHIFIDDVRMFFKDPNDPLVCLLMETTTQEVMDFLEASVIKDSTETFVTALWDKENNGDYQWIWSTEPLHTHLWAPDEPKENGKCVVLKRDDDNPAYSFKLMTADCSEKFRVICKRIGQPEAPKYYLEDVSGEHYCPLETKYSVTDQDCFNFCLREKLICTGFSIQRGKCTIFYYNAKCDYERPSPAVINVTEFFSCPTW